MNFIKKYKVDPLILGFIILFALISIITIKSSSNILATDLSDLYIKQTYWYLIGFVIVIIIMFISNDFIYRHIWWLYGLFIILLGGLLLFADPINNAKCWYTIKGIGSFQPSEFMKIVLIITEASMINKFNNKYPNPTIKDEFIFLLKILLVVFIPSILTFLQPDTGVVFIYLIITVVMLFISGIRYRWFIIMLLSILSIVGIVLGVYFLSSDLFINIFGTSFFLRIDRLLDWGAKAGFQLENGMSAIGSGGLLGHGFGNTPIYFPEAQTDFIFAVFASNFGFIGTIFLLSLICLFDIRLINTSLKNGSNMNKYVMAGILGMLIYQQIQNIGMTVGLLPITGITLPFVSYGGSSLLSYMIMLGIIFNISNENIRYKNK